MICNFFVKRFDNMLDDPKMEKRVKSTMEHFCSMMPHTFEKQCIDFTTEYFDFTYKILEQFLKPEQVCSSLHLCPISYSETKWSICELCRVVIMRTNVCLADPEFEKAVKSRMNDACMSLPHQFQQRCLDYGKQNFDTVFKSLKDLIGSPHLCNKIYLCPSVKTGKTFILFFNCNIYSSLYFNL